jgi:FAD/FMN-containing dehydrogenase
MTAPVVDGAALRDLRAGFAGEVLLPGEAGYEDARTIFNAMIDRRPAVIAQCERVEDVAAAIRFGRRTGLEIGVRGGGHSVAGKALADGGLVVDLRRMHAVTVDPEARTATVAGGATMSHLDRATSRTAWRPPAAGCRPPGWAGSRSAAEPGGWTGRWGWPATT